MEKLPNLLSCCERSLAGAMLPQTTNASLPCQTYSQTSKILSCPKLSAVNQAHLLAHILANINVHSRQGDSDGWSPNGNYLSFESVFGEAWW